MPFRMYSRAAWILKNATPRLINSSAVGETTFCPRKDLKLGGRKEKLWKIRVRDNEVSKSHLKGNAKQTTSHLCSRLARGSFDVSTAKRSLSFGWLASEKIMARNKIFRVAEPFLLSALAFKCKVLFKWHRFPPPLCSVSTPPLPVPYWSFLFSLPSPSHPISLSLFLSLLGHVSFSSYLRLLSSSFFHLVSSTRFDILYLTFLLFLVGGTVRTQLRRPWDKRLHFLIFKCAQTSYPAIVCPTEALRRGFRADKPVQPSMHATNAAASYYRVPLCSHLLSLLSSFSRLLSLPLYVSFLVSLRSSLTANKARSSRWKMQIATGESNGYEIVRDAVLSFRTDPVITKSQGSFFSSHGIALVAMVGLGSTRANLREEY